MPRLVFNPDEAEAEVVTLESGSITVGSSEEDNVCVDADAIGKHRLRFEFRDGLVTVVDIGEQKGLRVDGRPVERFVLGHRALVEVGALKILFLEDAPAAATALMRVGGAPAELSRQQLCPHCGAPRPESESTCRRCGMIQPHGAGVTPLAPADLYVAPEQTPHARGAGILPMLSFFFGLFGPLVLGIGWLLGIIFGFISLSLIRQRGGFVRDRRHATLGITFGFLWIAVMGLAGFGYLHYQQQRLSEAQTQATIRLNEDQAAFMLKEIAVVQEYLRATRAVPLEGGAAGYASLEQLRTLPNPFVPNTQFRERMDGYLFTVKAHGAEGFVATAQPERYGVTGRMTFSIDQTGILHGADLRGAAPWQAQSALRPLEMGRSVYLDARDRIARELLQEARRLAEEKQFERSRFVLRELQRKYTLTETFKNFESVARGVEQLIINAHAEAEAAKVEPLLKEGRKPEALAMLKQILAAYPTAANAPDLKAQAAALENELTAARNQEAEQQWARAVALEKAGQLEEALAAYRTFASSYRDTEVAQRHKKALQTAIVRLEDEHAAVLLSAITALNVRSNAAQVAKLVGELQADYGKTPTVKRHAAMLQSLAQQAESFVLAETALALRQQNNYVSAAEHLDKALALNPSLAPELAGVIEDCYLKAGEACLKTNRLAEAAAFFGKFLQLTPNPEKLERDKLKELYLALGELNYLNRDYTNAISYFRKGAEFFGTEPKYYRMFAQSLLRQKQYADAIPVYNAFVTLAPNDPQARFERALCGLGVSLELQERALGLLAAGKTNVIVAAAEQRPSTASSAIIGQMVSASASPVYSSSSRSVRAQQAAVQSKQVALQSKVLDLLRDKQFEARLAETMERVKGYTPQTPEAIILRESIRLVNEIQSISDELKALARDARNDEAQNKVETARNQLLAVFTTQQDYFDKIIAEKLAIKQELLSTMERWRAALDVVAQDLKVAATLEVYRGAVAEMDEPLQKKLKLFGEAYDLLKPVLATETKSLEEARELIRLAINKFKGWAIGWDLNERIQQFFFTGYTEIAEKHAASEKKLREAAAIVIPFEKSITF
ncbi:MAG: tetratricopeptide repeat protein [Verrucomicrobiae bacterium]|nr:tetratricopeptide repeat protein [Verrucomicrobiae bacterium]